MFPTIDCKNEPFGQKITLSCRCIVPSWQLIGDNLVCSNCGTSININEHLKQLIQPSQNNDIGCNLTQISDLLEQIKRNVDFAQGLADKIKMLQSENNQKDVLLREYESSKKEMENTSNYFQRHQESIESLDIRNLIKQVLSFISKIENDCKQYGDNPKLLNNRIDNNLYLLKEKIEEHGITLISHAAGEVISADDNGFLDFNLEDTGEKSLDKKIKQSDCLGCIFPNDIFMKINEKVTIWNYSPKLDPNSKSVKIIFDSNDHNNVRKEICKYVGESIFLNNYFNLFTPMEHHHLLGWALSKNEDVISDSEMIIQDDTTLYAIWTDKHNLTIKKIFPDRVENEKRIISYGQSIILQDQDGLQATPCSYISNADDDEELIVHYSTPFCSVKIESTLIEAYETGQEESLGVDFTIEPNKSFRVLSSLEGFVSNRLIFLITPKKIRHLSCNYSDDGSSINLYINAQKYNSDNNVKYAAPKPGSYDFTTDEISVQINPTKIMFAGHLYKLEKWNVEENDDSLISIIISFKKFCKVRWTAYTDRDYDELCHYGTTPVYKYDDVVRECDKKEKIAFFFIRWEPSIEIVTKNVEYRAQFEKGDYKSIILLAIDNKYDTVSKIHGKTSIPETEISEYVEKMVSENILTKEPLSKRKKKDGTLTYRYCKVS